MMILQCRLPHQQWNRRISHLGRICPIQNQYHHFNALSISSLSSSCPKFAATRANSPSHKQIQQHRTTYGRLSRKNQDIQNLHPMTLKAITASNIPTRRVHSSSSSSRSTGSHPTAAASFISSTASFHFATTEFADTILHHPHSRRNKNNNTKDDDGTNETTRIRQQALQYLNQTFDPTLWFQDPIESLVNGDKLGSSEDAVVGSEASHVIVDTTSAMGMVNGKQKLANPIEIALIQSHIQSLHRQPLRNTTTITPVTNDLRKPIRHVEDMLLSRHVGYLVGNQCMDYFKQDGITEIEEAISVNQIERQMNDMLLQQEIAGTVEIHRQPIYISTVSNFSNFLDLCRKALRALELGIPIVVLCRTNYSTTQHSYRWVQLLIDLCCDVGIDPSMITYISASLSDVQAILQVCEHTTGNLYATCSRSVASDIMNIYPKTIASTSGPNTLVCTHWDNAIDKSHTMSKMAQAIADSATIESAGQCTALRHCVVPTTLSDEDCQKILLDNITTVDSPVKALSESHYAGIIAPLPNKSSNVATTATLPSPTEEYQKLDTRQRHQNVDVYIKINNESLNDSTSSSNALLTSSENTIQEYWRQVVVDFTKFDLVQNKSIKQGKIEIRPVDDNAILKLASWLNIHQPISLAINGPRHESIMVGIALWERTALVVYTMGSSDDLEQMPPALTCQARPQDGECFGEFPPRNTMQQYTNFPVIIPSSNPSYDTTYKEEYLQSRGRNLSEYMNKSTKNMLLAITNNSTRGYCVLLIEYLQNACRKNPKLGSSKLRSVLYGLQRPPLQMKTILRCTPHSTYDELIPVYILFHVTNARNQAELSIHPDNVNLIQMCQQLKIPFTIESDADFVTQFSKRTDVFHSVTISGMSSHGPPSRYHMVGNFVSLYLPLGHIKSTMVNDAEFEMKVRMSDKWLSTVF